MKTGIILTFAIAALELNAHGGGTETNYGQAVIPLIVMNDAGIRDAVEALTHQAEINCIFDPRVLKDIAGSGSEPLVNLRWTNVTAQIALDRLLKANRLIMVTNQVTTVARIVRLDQDVKPVSASRLGNDTNQIIPLVEMKEALLGEAIKSLAREANLAYIIDPAARIPLAGPLTGLSCNQWFRFAGRS